MTSATYTDSNSSYLKLNPDWHIGDSPWKAEQILKIIKKNSLNPARIAEVGCGAGEILNQLFQRLSDEVSFYGYEIAPDAIRLCESRKKDRLNFFNESPFQGETNFDILIAADVLEHVEDCYSFVKNCGETAVYKIYHIPIELSVISILRNMPIKTYHSVGHLHVFTKDTALALIQHCGQTIVDYAYTAAALEAPAHHFRTKLLNLPRRILYRLNKDFCVRLFGGYSLLVLAK